MLHCIVVLALQRPQFLISVLRWLDVRASRHQTGTKELLQTMEPYGSIPQLTNLDQSLSPRFNWYAAHSTLGLHYVGRVFQEQKSGDAINLRIRDKLPVHLRWISTVSWLCHLYELSVPYIG